jgi:hypothetical protein
MYEVGTMLYDSGRNELAQIIYSELEEDGMTYHLYWFKKQKTSLENTMYVKLIRGEYLMYKYELEKGRI